jgi:transposase
VQGERGSHLLGMQPPIFVREPSAEERARLEAALRGTAAFTVRRAQIVLLSAEGRRPREIAQGLRCAVQTVRNSIRAFNANGVASLVAASSRPRSAAPVLGAAELERLRAILHQSPRTFGQARSTWTLALLAEVAQAEGLSASVLSIETIRQALLRLEVGWKRAKRWLTSPDPAYAQKTPPRPADRLGTKPGGLDAGLCRRSLVLPLRATGPARLDSSRRAAPPDHARGRP